MKDEIKEINIPNDILAILGDLTNGAMNYYKNPKVIELKYKLLLDYITNLQEKYEEADNDRHKLFEQKEKAIEYCNLYTRLSAKDLLNILGGGDANEN